MGVAARNENRGAIIYVLTLVLEMFQIGRMVRQKLDTVNECARRGYNLRIICSGCNRVVEDNAVLMMQALRGKGMALDKLEERAKCSECGHRGATVMPCGITF